MGLLVELQKDRFWNPWTFEERADDLERAGQIIHDWERAKPGFRTMTKRQMDEQMTRRDRDFEKERAAPERRRVKNKAR